LLFSPTARNQETQSRNREPLSRKQESEFRSIKVQPPLDWSIIALVISAGMIAVEALPPSARNQTNHISKDEQAYSKRNKTRGLAIYFKKLMNRVPFKNENKKN
jgi:hypothetical protein